MQNCEGRILSRHSEGIWKFGNQKQIKALKTCQPMYRISGVTFEIILQGNGTQTPSPKQ